MVGFYTDASRPEVLSVKPETFTAFNVTLYMRKSNTGYLKKIYYFVLIYKVLDLHCMTV